MENLVLNYVIPILGSFVSILLLMLTRKAISWLNVKLGIATSMKLENDVEVFIKDAVFAAEEKAQRAAKLGMPVWTSGMKYRWVADVIGNRFPTLTKEEADMKVHAMLGKTLGLGATQTLGEQCVEEKPRCEIETVKP